MGTNNIISSNGKIFVVDEGCLGKPFIYRGDLTDEELRQWLYQIAHAIKCKNAPNDVIEESRKEIGILESKRSDAERIVLAHCFRKYLSQ
ncbi:Uncharacterised protein [Serratia ficaria]|uniref:hypothetical protein n=1 Tax=Serratia ficaria TaxID=61651 RepID=UPI00218284B9|nr:hypothetical protein [Serratia ficaria]CAI2488813.1 Uncharacterised protein [Serratia ficaria]CAI2533412.1 Uncharacterised protein [Serratia ficaria]